MDGRSSKNFLTIQLYEGLLILFTVYFFHLARRLGTNLIVSVPLRTQAAVCAVGKFFQGMVVSWLAADGQIS